eukprot:g2224.t1
MTYKEEKEQFVEGFKGTSIYEICIVSILAPMGIWLYLSAFRGGTLRKRCRNFVAEFSCVVMPMICACTIFSDRLLKFISVMIGTIVWMEWRRDTHGSVVTEESRERERRGGAYLSWFRGCVLLFTCICILAVDFTVFPRRFAKTEVYGTGLMDIGVGCFVFSGALVSRVSRGRTRATMTASRFRRLMQVTCLGILRFVVHSGIDYQVHISEYGVHWNFFFTLATLMCVSATLPVSAELSLPFGVGLAVAYQYLLSYGGLETYILTAPRDRGYFAANREGILGSIGFLAIHYVTVGIGRTCVHSSKSDPLPRLLILGAGLWVALCGCSIYVAPVSRRMVNLTYVIWVLAHNVMMLVALLCVQKRFRNPPPSVRMLEKLSRWQLAVFLVANVATGAVNLSMETIHKGPIEGLSVVSIYMLGVCAFSYWMLHD